MRIEEITRYQHKDTKKWHVIFKYAPKDACFCTAKKVEKVFETNPTIKEITQSVSTF